MNIALVGYGKMGKEVEQVALERGWTAGVRLTSQSDFPSSEVIRGIDVVVHFARAADVERHAAEWAKAGKPLVIGTTGWGSSMDAVRKLIEQAGTGLVYGSNFSLGMHIFQRIVKHAGALINRFEDYDIGIQETHHKEKADSPSGTALTLGNLLLNQIARKSELLTGTPQGAVKPAQLQISSARTGNVVGTHSVLFDSAADAIELTHRAKNRRGFALGALLAAEWIHHRTGFYSFEEVMAKLLDI
jgi:4-hydroxy-tetrahydrodipicolinate reductase